MLQPLVINAIAAPAESESVSPWDGGCVSALGRSVFFVCKHKGTFLLHSRTNDEYFIFCVNPNVPSLVPRPFPKSTVECVPFLVQPGVRRSVPRRKRRPYPLCQLQPLPSADAAPPAAAFAYRCRSHLWRAGRLLQTLARGPRQDGCR